jgi:hypothetical protein
MIYLHTKVHNHASHYSLVVEVEAEDYMDSITGGCHFYFLPFYKPIFSPKVSFFPESSDVYVTLNDANAAPTSELRTTTFLALVTEKNKYNYYGEIESHGQVVSTPES